MSDFTARVRRVATVQGRALSQRFWQKLPEHVARTRYLGFDLEYPSRSIVGRTISRGEVWDRPLQVIVDGLAPSSLVADIGANIGGSTLTMLARRSDLRVFCFEPATRFFPHLDRNIRINRLEQRVTCLNLGVNSSGQDEVLYVNSTTASAAVADYDGHRPDRSETMRCVPLDGFFDDRTGIPSLIKIDTDGFEMQVIASGRRLLTQHHPTLFVEFSPGLLLRSGHQPAELLGTLEGMGYASADVYAPSGALLRASIPLSELLPIEASYVDLALRA